MSLRLSQPSMTSRLLLVEELASLRKGEFRLLITELAGGVHPPPGPPLPPKSQADSHWLNMLFES